MRILPNRRPVRILSLTLLLALAALTAWAWRIETHTSKASPREARNQVTGARSMY